MKKIPGKTLSAGRPITNNTIRVAAAVVHARGAKPVDTVHGINTRALPRTSTTPVKYRNHSDLLKQPDPGSSMAAGLGAT